ncbi:STY4528 family pathogenicity island replication protein [Paraburkholderia ginsengisoli]
MPSSILTRTINSGDAFLFSGNRHESVPRALFLDPRLTPLERNAWQVIRMQLNTDGLTAFPTYEQLRPFLASMPCAAKASFETVARALTLLRLTRWLSLVQRRRDPRTGRMQGNVYVLHDEPLTPFEAMQLDPEYLGLVSHALTHASKAIQRIGQHVLREISEDPMLGGRILPTRLQIVMDRLARQGWESAGEDATASTAVSYPQDAAVHESEAGREPLPVAPLPNPKQDRTVRTKSIYSEVRTVPRVREASAPPHLRLPQRFNALKDEQQAGALIALQQVEANLQQAVLDEWDTRCQASIVRHPAGYLFGTIQKAIRGEFKAWAIQQATPARAPARPETPPRRPGNPAQAQEHIARLRAMLRIT